MSQSNTRVGDIRVLAGEDLSDTEGRLVKMTHDGGVAEMLLPTANSDYALFVLLEGGEDAGNVSVRPVQPDCSRQHWPCTIISCPPRSISTSPIPK